MATTCKTGPNYSDGGQKPVMKMKAPVQVSDEACHFEASRNQKIRKRITAFLPGRAGHKAWRVIVATAPSTASAGPREKANYRRITRKYTDQQAHATGVLPIGQGVASN